MAPHAEPSPPPSPSTETPKPPPDQSNFLSHASTIPILADSQRFFGTYSPRILTDILTKASTYVPPSVLKHIDKFGDAALTQVEHSFPAVKTPTEEVLARPKKVYEVAVVRPAGVVRTTIETYKDAGGQKVRALGERVVSGYKKYVEPVVGEWTDGYVRKLNDRFEGAVEAGMPKSYSEAVAENGAEVESEAEGREIEIYRSMRIVRTAAERGRVRFFAPLGGMVRKTVDDVKEGGKGIKAEIRGSPGKVRDGVVYMWRVWGEEVEREKGEVGKVGVKGVVKVGYRVGERCVGEVVGVGLTVVAKSMGVVWGIWEAGREKVKMT